MEEYEDEELEQEEMEAPVEAPKVENELEILVGKLEKQVAELEEKMNIVHKNIRVHHKLLGNLQENFKILLEQVDKE